MIIIDFHFNRGIQRSQRTVQVRVLDISSIFGIDVIVHIVILLLFFNYYFGLQLSG
jgi:hypothetical protein